MPAGDCIGGTAILIDTKKGQINSRFVKIVRHRKSPGEDGKRRWTTFVIDAEGGEYEVFGRHIAEDVFEPIAKVIPAIQPMTLLILTIDEPEQIYEHRFPIVGWRIAWRDYPEPIAPGCEVGEFEGDNWLALIELPGGGYQAAGYEDARFATLEECHR